MDRFVCLFIDLYCLVDEFIECGVFVKFFKEGQIYLLDFSLVVKFMFGLFGLVVEFECLIICECQVEGIVKVKVCGVYKGCVKVFNEE